MFWLELHWEPVDQLWPSSPGDVFRKVTIDSKLVSLVVIKLCSTPNITKGERNNSFPQAFWAPTIQPKDPHDVLNKVFTRVCKQHDCILWMWLRQRCTWSSGWASREWVSEFMLNVGLWIIHCSQLEPRRPSKPFKPLRQSGLYTPMLIIHAGVLFVVFTLHSHRPVLFTDTGKFKAHPVGPVVRHC